jgi:hypothetical protein
MKKVLLHRWCQYVASSRPLGAEIYNNQTIVCMPLSTGAVEDLRKVLFKRYELSHSEARQTRESFFPFLQALKISPNK